MLPHPTRKALVVRPFVVTFNPVNDTIMYPSYSFVREPRYELVRFTIPIQAARIGPFEPDFNY